MRLTIFVILLSLSSASLAEYLAYSVTDKGNVPLPEHIDDIDAKHLMNLVWGDFAGKRARIGVLEVDNNSTTGTFKSTDSSGVTYESEWSTSGGTVPVNGIEAIITDTLNRSGRFRIVERAALDEVLGEQDLAASGRVAQTSGAATGQVLGAELLLQVVITDYETGTSESSGSSAVGSLFRKVPVIGGVGMKSGKGRVGLNFRLIDATTSEVLKTKQVESIISESGLTFSGTSWNGDGAMGGFISDYAKTPIGQAVIAGINMGIYDVAKQIGRRPAEGSVVKAEGTRVWLNIGKQGVNMGDRLSVMQKGEELIDPETGISLGSSDTAMGDIEVIQVADKYSVAQWVTLKTSPNRGDRVVSQAAPPTIEYAEDWSLPK
jgi:curli biogenesis system outer membrane secretion channel CsgG